MSLNGHYGQSRSPDNALARLRLLSFPDLNLSESDFVKTTLGFGLMHVLSSDVFASSLSHCCNRIVECACVNLKKILGVILL